MDTRISDMLETSRSFVAAGRLIIEDAKMEKSAATACCAVAFEIGLKALITSEGNNPPQIHHLGKLLAKLSPPTQNAFFSRQEKLTGRSPEQAKIELDKQASAFEEARYPYEKRYLFSSPGFLCRLADACIEEVNAHIS